MGTLYPPVLYLNPILMAKEGLEPIVADDFFSCYMKMDATFKEGGRQSMEEICLYQVKDGKIVQEEFFYTPNPQG